MENQNKSDTFYKALEDEFRGSAELIKRRLSFYLPYVLSFKSVNKNVIALDLGSGRGEWLELLIENGIQARGIDTNDSMVMACNQKKIPITKIDALTALKLEKDSSVHCISAFHLIEHMKFNQLIELIEEAYRVLKPGGILICETPNCDNMNVATSTFYLDPTHQNPIPSKLLSLCFKQLGFVKNKAIHLNSDIADTTGWITLKDVICSSSRDYGLIGQKGDSEIYDDTNIFNHETGSEIVADSLLKKFDDQLLQLQNIINITNDTQRRIRRIEKPLFVIKNFFKKLKTQSFKAIKPKEIYIDISEIINNDSATGVQRVTRSILHALSICNFKNFKITPVYATTREIGYRYARENTSTPLGFECTNFDQKIIYKSGDIFLGLDLQHHVTILQAEELDRMRKSGMTTYFVVYDLLPIKFPEFWDSRHHVTRIHEDWLKVVCQSNGAICISATVAKELKEWVSDFDIKTSKNFRITSFHLGSDLLGEDKEPEISVSNFFNSNLLTRNNFFLMVGTIEPRKGYDQVIRAFELLWAGGCSSKLVIVGKKGWLSDAVYYKIKYHSELNHKLFLVENAKDNDLTYLYANCECLLAASYGEGFGLPLVEAAKNLKPIIARDIGVFREICQEHAFYFNGTKPEDISKAILTWKEHKKNNLQPSSGSINTINWNQSALELYEILTK